MATSKLSCRLPMLRGCDFRNVISVREKYTPLHRKQNWRCVLSKLAATLSQSAPFLPEVRVEQIPKYLFLSGHHLPEFPNSIHSACSDADLPATCSFLHLTK